MGHHGRRDAGDAPLTGVLLLLLAAALLVAGAELFVENAAGAARRLGVTVLAVAVLLAGAEPEELLTAVLAAAQDRPGLAAGDAVGANVTMLTAALGLAALVRPLPVGRRTRLYAAGSALAGVLGVAALHDGAGRAEGGLLLLAYLGLVAAVWLREKEPPGIGELAEVGEERSARSTGRALLLVLVGLALMTAGGVAAVEGAIRLVSTTGATDSAIGLTALALATTAELFAIVLAAARHGVEEVAVAAVVGSTAYNATATLGAAALVADLPGSGVLGAAAVAAALPLVVLLLAARGTLGRSAGAGLVATYAAFLAVVLVLG